ncbi:MULTISPECIES: hypothetical protein [unclassified Methylobacterium]|jgi:hypothetical protein|uniref:hypothetical protein n=1 Tax=unclassified Methylobacterium TaxID=2615210 RepID=UPI001352C2C2|nr:hypothetical protein [Methylobacterium sp. 2A]MWV25202.1 hypothetical protein [Methylobacterium sp. 2A]
MAKIADMELLAEERPEQLKKVIVDLRADIAAVMHDGLSETSPLAQMPSEKRSMYEYLFDLVYEARQTASQRRHWSTAFSTGCERKPSPPPALMNRQPLPNDHDSAS